MSDVLKPIYKEASEAAGREFEYPKKQVNATQQAEGAGPGKH
jgi:hypothetical protein